jgi:hypothetical protein
MLPQLRMVTYEVSKVAAGVIEYTNHCRSNSFLPTSEGLAVHLSVARSTLYDRANPKSDRYHEEFSYILEQLPHRHRLTAGAACGYGQKEKPSPAGLGFPLSNMWCRGLGATTYKS